MTWVNTVPTVSVRRIGLSGLTFAVLERVNDYRGKGFPDIKYRVKDYSSDTK